MELWSLHLPEDLFSGQLGAGVPGPWQCRLGAEQVSPTVFLGWALCSCQAANSSELLPNMNRLVSRAGGSRSCYQPRASGPQPDPSPVSPFRL